MHSTVSTGISEGLAAIRATRAATRAQLWTDETEALIDDLRNVHREVTRWFAKDEVRRHFRLRAQLFDEALKSGMGITGLRPLHQMSRADFSDLERRVRQVRAARPE